MKHAVVFTLLVAACGGGSKPEPTARPAPVDPIPMAEPTPSGPVTATTEPKVEPAEPAPDPMKKKMELLAAETAAYEKARPVFEANCASCHQKGGKGAKSTTLDHFDMTTYPFGGHHAVEVATEIRRVLAIGGGAPTMPKNKPGKVKGDDLALVATWADAFDASHAGGAHEPMNHGGMGEHKH